MTPVEQVRAIAATLPRAYEVLVRDRIKWRVGSTVWFAFSRDEQTIGFAFPKEERQALVDSRPDVFFLPGETDLRFHWVCAWVDRLDPDELEEVVLDAWSLCVPKKVVRERFGS